MRAILLAVAASICAAQSTFKPPRFSGFHLNKNPLGDADFWNVTTLASPSGTRERYFKLETDSGKDGEVYHFGNADGIPAIQVSAGRRRSTRRGEGEWSENEERRG